MWKTNIQMRENQTPRYQLYSSRVLEDYVQGHDLRSLIPHLQHCGRPRGHTPHRPRPRPLRTDPVQPPRGAESSWSEHTGESQHLKDAEPPLL